MNEIDLRQYISGFSLRSRKDWNRVDEITVRCLENFRKHTKDELEEYAGYFYDAWNFEEGEEEDFTAFVILKWMADHLDNLPSIPNVMDDNTRKIEYIKACVRSGIQGRATLDW